MKEVTRIKEIPEPTKMAIRILVKTYYDYQRERMMVDGRMRIKKNGEIKKDADDIDQALVVHLYEQRKFLLESEMELQKEIAKVISKHPLWQTFLKDVKGVGPVIAAVLISEIDIQKATTASKIWQFAGMNPGMVRGKVWKKLHGQRIMVATDTRVRGDKKTKGFVCPYNAFLKRVLLGILGPSFLKCNSPYAEIYHDTRHRLESMDWGVASAHPTDRKRPKANHQHRAANRKMVKQFLVDLYIAWRQIEGLPVRPPYSEEYLGKKHSA